MLALSLFFLLALPCFADGRNKVKDGAKDAGDVAGGILDDAGDMLEDAGDKVEDATDKDHKDDEANDGNNAEDGVTDDGATGDKDGVIGDENSENDTDKKPQGGESGAMDDDTGMRNGTVWAIIIGLIIAAIVVLLIVLLIPGKNENNTGSKNR